MTRARRAARAHVPSGPHGEVLGGADVVIVGGGTAGAVVARRLSDAGASVALLEEGPSDLGEERVMELRRWPELLGDERFGHDFVLEPQARGNSRVLHSRGVMLGGCSSHNSCIAFVPPDADFGRWRAQGALGWGAEDVAPYVERVLATVSLERSSSGNALVEAFLAAAAAAGYRTLDLARELGEGAGWFRLNKRGTVRSSSSMAYLHPLTERARGLRVFTHTRARRLLLDGGRAVAVETDRGLVEVGQEAIVSAGAFGSPKLLMLSGLGPGAHLQEVGVGVVADLPGVGADLQDHPEGVILWQAARPVPPESANLYEAGLFACVDQDVPFPDLMAHFGTEAFDLQTLPAGYPTAENAFSMTPNVARSRSRGRVSLRSDDPADDPRIDFRYFVDDGGYDERILVAGLKLAREIARREPLASWVARELAPGPEVVGDAELGAYARATHNTVYHPAGTCRMGIDDDAPVDPDLRVRGTDNVRVADASVFPSMVSVNPALTCMIVGEACADRVLGRGPASPGWGRGRAPTQGPGA